MAFYKKIFILLINLNLSTIFYAKDQFIKFEQISHAQGLSSRSVRCILKDKKGFIWIGTSDGLNKYDGYNITVYKNCPLDSNSLSNNWIIAMYEDNSGYLWIGTRGGGLNKFDSEKEIFKRYKEIKGDPNCINSNIIRTIYEDREGVFWIGTYGGGLNKFDREKEIFVHYKSEEGNPNSLSSNYVVTICEDSDEISNILWIGTDGGGLNKFDRKKETFTHYKHDENNPNGLSHNRVTAVYLDRSGVLWVGTYSGGLNRFDREKETFVHYTNERDNPNCINHNRIRVICEDTKGMLWIGTYVGLNKFNRDKEIFVNYKDIENKPNSLITNHVTSICEDRSGVIWIGTLSGGIKKLDQKREIFRHRECIPGNPNSLCNSMVRVILEDPEKPGHVFWIGTDNGLDRFDLVKGTFIHYKHQKSNSNSLSNNKILALSKDRYGVLWIGTDNGLNKFVPRSNEEENGIFIRYKNNKDNLNSLSQNSVKVIYEDPDENGNVLWIGTNGGLIRFDVQNDIFISYQKEEDNPNSLSNNNVRVICKDKTGVLWIGTDDGLNKFDPRAIQEVKEIFIHYKNEKGNPNSLCYNMIRAIYEDRNGILWIGTRGGLDRFDPETEQFSHYTEKDGLSCGVIYGILEDSHGNLWLSTLNGLSKFNLQTKTIRNYNKDDGLYNEEFHRGACCKSKSGEMIFGGTNGIDIFYPDSIQNNPNIPPVVITAFKKFDRIVKFKKSISELKKIKLSYKDNFFSLEFAALDYVNPYKNQYAYQMEGFDQDWIYCGTRRYVSYTNLNPGKYTFRVKGSNNDNLWNEEGTSVKIIITPPFWKTLWFRITAIIVISFLIIMIFQVRTYRIREANKRLEKHVEDRTVDLRLVNKELQQEVLERKRTEEALRESEAKYRMLFNRSQDGVSLIEFSNQNKKGRFIETNDILCKMLNYTFEEFSNLNTHDILASETIKEIVKIKEQIFNKKHALFEAVFKTKDNQKVPVEVNAHLIDFKGNPAVFSIVRDITERKRAEAKLKNYSENLEKLVGKKTEELLKLERKKFHLEKLAAVGMVTSTMVHEIRNPLSSIKIGLTSLGSRVDLLERDRHCLDVATREVIRLEKMLKNLLDFAKPHEFRFTKHDINKVLDLAVDRLRDEFSNEGIYLQREFAKNLPKIDMDIEKFNQAIYNILINAKQALGRRGKIFISSKGLPEIGKIRIDISDNGHGIKKEDLKHVFEPFFSREREGTGLGLALVQKIVEAHGGKIEINSSWKKGTYVNLEFDADFNENA